MKTSRARPRVTVGSARPRSDAGARSSSLQRAQLVRRVPVQTMTPRRSPRESARSRLSTSRMASDSSSNNIRYRFALAASWASSCSAVGPPRPAVTFTGHHHVFLSTCTGARCTCRPTCTVSTKRAGPAPARAFRHSRHLSHATVRDRAGVPSGCAPGAQLCARRGVRGTAHGRHTRRSTVFAGLRALADSGNTLALLLVVDGVEGNES